MPLFLQIAENRNVRISSAARIGGSPASGTDLLAQTRPKQQMPNI
jgi:hypothetical protein